MKNIAITVTLFISGILLFSSCQREVGETPEPPGGDPDYDKVLWKLAQLDTTRPSGLDTVDVYYFNYDAQGRVTRLTNYSRSDTSNNPAYTYTSITDFYYQGNDTLAYKTTNVTNSDNENFKDTTFYSYQNELVSYDSSRYVYNDPFDGPTLHVSVQTYVNTGNTTTGRFTLNKYGSSPAGPYVYDFTCNKTYSQGNITESSYSSTGWVIGSFSQQFTYDNKVNPLYRATIHYPLVTTDRLIFQEGQKNNITRWIMPSWGADITNTYTYREDGYPLIVRGKDAGDPDYNSKCIYFYKN